MDKEDVKTSLLGADKEDSNSLARASSQTQPAKAVTNMKEEI